MSGVVGSKPKKEKKEAVTASGTELSRLVNEREAYVALEAEYEQLVDEVVAAKQAQEAGSAGDSGRLGAGVAAAAEKRVNDLFAKMEAMQQKLLAVNIADLEAKIAELEEK